MCYWEENISKQIGIPSFLTVFVSIPFNKLTWLKSLLHCCPWLLQSLRPSDQDHQILIDLDFVLNDNFFENTFTYFWKVHTISEKATKVKEGDFFNFIWPSQKTSPFNKVKMFYNIRLLLTLILLRKFCVFENKHLFQAFFRSFEHHCLE